jgi:hypothetical protein
MAIGGNGGSRLRSAGVGFFFAFCCRATFDLAA